MKKILLTLVLVTTLTSCAISRFGEMIPGKMMSIDGTKTLDFGIELVPVTAGRGDLLAYDNKEDIHYTGYYSFSCALCKDSEGYNTAGSLFGGGKVYSVHLVIVPSYGPPSGEGVAKENGKIKYRITFPVYE